MAKADFVDQTQPAPVPVEPQKGPIKPIPLFRFAEKVRGSADEIWLGILRMSHSAEKHDIAGWNAIIDSYRTRPAHKGS